MNTAIDLKLYEIAGEIQAILSEEEWTEETEKRLEGLSMALEAKADSLISFTESLSSFAAYAKAEEERIAAKRKAVENRIKSIKGYLLASMQAAGRDQITIGTRKVSVQNNPPAVAVDDEQAIPAKYFVIIPEQKQLDKKALSADLKQGPVPGAHLEQGVSLRVR